MNLHFLVILLNHSEFSGEIKVCENGNALTGFSWACLLHNHTDLMPAVEVGYEVVGSSLA